MSQLVTLLNVLAHLSLIDAGAHTPDRVTQKLYLLKLPEQLLKEIEALADSGRDR